MTGPSVPMPPAPPTNFESALDSRTELQAQLALLAVQLAELSQAEETVSVVQAASVQHLPTSVPSQDLPSVPTHDPPPPPQIPSANPVPDLNTSETENEDDDMEEII